MKPTLTAIASAALAALAFPVWGQDAELYVDDSLVVDVTYGLNCAVDIVGSMEAPGTERGQVDVFDRPPELDPQGQLVPALMGMGFGVRARAADGVSIIGATFRVTHPPFGGSGTTEQTWSASYTDGSHSTHLYRFDYPHEAVTGTWVMEASHEGRVLYRIPFTVVPPEAYPGSDDLCDPEGLLSHAQPEAEGRSPS